MNDKNQVAAACLRLLADSLEKTGPLDALESSEGDRDIARRRNVTIEALRRGARALEAAGFKLKRTKAGGAP